jgi:hypothetical protein
MLLIYETTEFAEKDLQPVQRYVQEKLHVEDWRWHYRLNSEWWRKTGHYLLVLISYRFNVSTRVNRLGRHDFGHPYLHLIDRLQDRYQQELFNILM